MIQSFFGVLLTSFVMSLAAIFCCSTVALGCRLMFLRRGSMCFNYMVVFAHGNTPLGMPRDAGSSLEVDARGWPSALMAFSISFDVILTIFPLQ
jgi:hypothetical protein